MAKLQTAEKTRSALDDQGESLVLIRAKIKEVRKNANGGIEQSRAERAQSLLTRKNHKVNKKQVVEAADTGLWRKADGPECAVQKDRRRHR
eukprot:11664732-Heterocapsa_arctica.AAC.1